MGEGGVRRVGSGFLVRQVYLCSDYLALAEDMRALFLASGRLAPAHRTTATVTAVDPAAPASPPPSALLPPAHSEAGPAAGWAARPSVVSWTEAVGSGRRRGWLGWRPFGVPTERDQVLLTDR